MACVMRSTYLSFRPIMFSSPVEKERAQVLFVFFFFFACCGFCLLPRVFFFFFLAASSITYLSALRFPYREGVEGGFVFFFFSTYLLYLVPLLVAVAYRESVCVFVCGWGGDGVAYHDFLLSRLRLRASCGFACVCVFVPLAPSLAFLTYLFVIPPYHCFPVVRGHSL